jgi:putative AbiEii toxin of type IV toxin-antitoxin system
MRLIKAKVSGYKRLARNCQMNLDANPLCIVGPNAAGKSSFLDALMHLNHDGQFDDIERTRVPGGKTLEPEIEARFLLDEHEIGLMGEIPEAVSIRQFLVTKKAGQNSRQYSAYPYPDRDLTARANVLSLLQGLQETGWIERAQAVEESLEPPPDPLVGALFATAVERASSTDQWLESPAGDFDALGERIGPILAQIVERDEADDEAPYEGPDWPAVPEEEALLEALPDRLAELARLEREEHPLRKVIRALAGRIPEFLKFDDGARTLESQYDLSGDEPDPELGVYNFLALAGTSWGEAGEVVQRNDPGWTKIYIDERDEELKREAALQWGQSEVEVKLSLNGSVLSILLSMQARDLIGFDEHSDGLKAFMALRAFVARKADQTDIRPIVLIDEADLHLHYDAQADLVGVFEEQEEAAQIIYTTHSAGCLPRDLAGVRAIVPETEEVDGKTKQKDHSEAINRYWTMGKGFSPLLLAMGAGAFAFSSTQYALITEGMSDALLLPTLIREATGEDHLRFQPVPSFAEATPDEIKQFDLIAGRIAFLADGDEGGRKHVEKLTKNGIGKAQIVYVGDDEDSGFSVEDLLAKSVYLKAVNDELMAWEGIEYPADELPEKGRSKAVDDWCAQKTGRDGKPVELSKVDVAQRVLDQRSPEAKLLAKASTVKKINENVLAVFEGAPERMKRLREAAAELAAQGEGDD